MARASLFDHCEDACWNCGAPDHYSEGCPVPPGPRIPVGVDSWSMCLNCGGYLRETGRSFSGIYARCEKCGDHTERRFGQRKRAA